MDEQRLDGEGALGTAVAELRSHIARLLAEAESRSAVTTAHAAAKRFTFREQAANAIQSSDSRSAPVLSIVVRDKYLSELDEIEAAVMKQQDDLLGYLARLVSPAPPTASEFGVATAPPGSDSPTVEMAPIVEVDRHPPSYEHGSHRGSIADMSLMHGAMIVGWFALVLVFVVVFLLTL